MQLRFGKQWWSLINSYNAFERLEVCSFSVFEKQIHMVCLRPSGTVNVFNFENDYFIIRVELDRDYHIISFLEKIKRTL